MKFSSKNLRWWASFFWIICCLQIHNSVAEVPETTVIQGTLKDSSGNAVVGSLPYRIGFYESQIGGASIALATGSVEFSDSGRFSIEVTIPPAALDTSEVWCQLAIDTDEDGFDGDDFFPNLVRVHSVPFSLRSADSDSLGGVPASEYLQSSMGSPEAWSLSGNSSIGSSFLGTTDDATLELRVDNLPALRIAPNETSPNLIGGHSGNSIDPGISGGVIGGGGMSGGFGPNRVAGDFATVSGGSGNTAEGFYSTIGGGVLNTNRGADATIAGGYNNAATAGDATVGGGVVNSASGEASAIAGGSQNVAGGSFSTIAGGVRNTANLQGSNVGGGDRNSATGFTSTIAGGSQNTATGQLSNIGGGDFNIASATNSSVGGGHNNEVTGAFGYIGGGVNNLVSGTEALVGGGSGNMATIFVATVGGGIGNTASGQKSTVSGGEANKATGSTAAIGGGSNNMAIASHAAIGGGFNNTASGDRATIAGGEINTASEKESTVGGGSYNSAVGEYSTIGGGRSNYSGGLESIVGGGEENQAGGNRATVGGGGKNEATGGESTVSGGALNKATMNWGTVSGGANNTASGEGSTVSGGVGNEAMGYRSAVLGGESNVAEGEYSLAFGRRAKALANGQMVFADSNNVDFGVAAENTFYVRSTGGAAFVTGIAVGGSTTSGVVVSAGDSSWQSACDRNLKENFESIDGQEILDRLDSIPIQSYNLKSQDPSIRHMGPVAQDFYAAFALGTDNLHINTVDADGVSLAAIQGLYGLVKAKEQTIANQQEEIEKLRIRLEKVEAIIAEIAQ
ncbi:MAG: tail fiber domain-containing protein [Candidatus Omnitrophica bacterium]|nr:tail fiber domain-containing protein [Candidatus Omnitrophota bacterium]MCB9783117.1 tail fiber domain-containing protein [Candidatus Omnitrophota bacterium]